MLNFKTLNSETQKPRQDLIRRYVGRLGLAAQALLGRVTVASGVPEVMHLDEKAGIISQEMQADQICTNWCNETFARLQCT